MLLLSELMQESFMLHCRQFFQVFFGAWRDLWQSLLPSPRQNRPIIPRACSRAVSVAVGDCAVASEWHGRRDMWLPA